MKYQYKVELKSWSELVSLSEYIDKDGFKFKELRMNKEQYIKLNKININCIETGFMGMKTHFFNDEECSKNDELVMKLPIWNYIEIN